MKNNKSQRKSRLITSMLAGLYEAGDSPDSGDVQYLAQALALDENDKFDLEPLAGNVFCPTGSGGGIDPGCSIGNKPMSGDEHERLAREARTNGDTEGEDYHIAMAGQAHADHIMHTASKVGAIARIQLMKMQQDGNRVAAIRRTERPQLEKLKESMLKEGFRLNDPISLEPIGRSRYTIHDGHHRLAAATELVKEGHTQFAYLPVRIIPGRAVGNVFCPTGTGGGKDPTCTKSESATIDPAKELKDSYEALYGPAGKTLKGKKRTAAQKRYKVAHATWIKSTMAGGGPKTGYQTPPFIKDPAPLQPIAPKEPSTEPTSRGGIFSSRALVSFPQRNTLDRGELVDTHSDEEASKVLADKSVSVGDVQDHYMRGTEPMKGVSVEGVLVRWSTFGEEGALDVAATSLREVAKSNLPEKLWKANDSITFALSTHSEDEIYQARFNRPGFVAAATGGDGGIVVYGGKPLSLGHFAHESAHNLAKETWGSSQPPSWSAYGKAQELEPPVSPYAEYSRSHAEDFAEAVRLYVTEPERLKKFYPYKHEALEEMLK